MKYNILNNGTILFQSVKQIPVGHAQNIYSVWV